MCKTLVNIYKCTRISFSKPKTVRSSVAHQDMGASKNRPVKSSKTVNMRVTCYKKYNFQVHTDKALYSAG